ncbi:hypothetical protein BGZ95_004161 [Linnemannia exigua]|uniref:SUN domain-containing protein n=1 Tax=Linnemannia exigua TaxID=604196 RepID=A0AAD4H943_9FUNG|nr:hypothetical protein BGZ95_004161 [Linnemannia exigua]
MIARGKATTTTTPPLYTSVDNLLLPGVIGATVEGPKTPIRSPNAKRVLDFFPHANNNSSDSNKNKMALPSSPFSVPQSRRANGNYIDTEVALDRPFSQGFSQKTARNSGNIPLTPQGKQYRKTFRPHDTPIAGSKRPQSSNIIDNIRNNGGSNGRKSGGPTSYLYQASPFVDDPADDRASPVSPFGHSNNYEDDEDDKENQSHSANLRSRQETDRTPTDRTMDHQFYSSQADNEKDPRDEFEYSNASEEDDEGLDIGEREDEIYPQERLRGNSYQDATLDDQEDESMDEQTELEIAELKREQEQLGFIKRWAHLLRQQRDEFGWGGSKQPDDYPSEGSDIDSDSSFTSARVRRESYQRKKFPVASRLSRVIAAPATASKSPSPQPLSPTPQPRSSTPQPLSSTPRRRLSTPQPRSPTPPQVSPQPRPMSPRSQPISPRSQPTPSRSQVTSARSSDKSPFNIPSMRQFDSGIGLDASQESYDEAEPLEEMPEDEAEVEEEEDGEEGVVRQETDDIRLAEVEDDMIVPDWPVQRRVTPSPRPSSQAGAFQDEQDERPYITERFDQHSDTSDYESETERPLRYGFSSRPRYSDEPQHIWHHERAYHTSYQPSNTSGPVRIYPWHVIEHAFVGYLDTVQNGYHSLTTTLERYFWAIFSWVSFIVLWPWTQRHAVSKTGKSWVRAGVASGLLRPGTLFGVVLLGLAVWGSHKFGYESFSGIKDGRACNNETVIQSPGRGPQLKEIVSNTWDKISWQATSYRGRDSSNKSTRRWFDWVPKAPSVDKWIPFRTDKKKPSSSPSPSPSTTIQIPTEQIQSLEGLESRIEWIQKKLADLDHADGRLDKELNSKLEGMSIWVSGVEHKLNRVSSDVNMVSNKVDSLEKYVRDGRWIEQTVLELVRDEIPRHLVVARDPKTGKLSIPSEFWDTARELFMTSEQVQKSIQDQVVLLGQDSDSDDRQEDDSSASGRWTWGGSSRSKKKGGKPIGWDDFLLENEKAMSSFVEGRMSKVSRTVFLGLVRTEANLIWQSLERNVVAMLEKQGKLEGKPAPTKGSHDSSADSPGRALTDIEQDLISGLIDKALEKYSADALAKPDYALYSAGGRIIPRLTSANYFHHVEPTLLGRLGIRFFVPLPRREKPAEKAIEPNMHTGECWAMNGQEGQLAIRLARKIVITEVTIEHADPSVVLDLGSAAREIEVWSLRGREDAAPSTPQSERPNVDPSSSATPAEEAKPETTSDESTTTPSSSKQASWWREGSPWPGSTLLTTIEFNANRTVSRSSDSNNNGDNIEATEKPKSRQTFSIPLSKQAAASVGVVFRIKSNWGHPKMTCIYRVRVHGYEPTETPDK